MVCNNVLEYIGHTPMIRLNRMNDPEAAEVLVKFEGLNVGGSIKTRTAYNMIVQAEKEGKIHKDTIIVEPTSGNQGIGLALIGAVKGYKTIIIMPDSVSEERRKLVAHYGAEVMLIHDAGNIGDCIDECLQTALRMAKENPNVYVPQQFENPANPMVHKHRTGLEIMEQGGQPALFDHGLGAGGHAFRIKGLAGQTAGQQGIIHEGHRLRSDDFPLLAGKQTHAFLGSLGREYAAEYAQQIRHALGMDNGPVIAAGNGGSLRAS